ncbi:MAG TPA: phosphopantetheine-binding protein, partial [Pseudonocardiaceae bacterium]
AAPHGPAGSRMDRTGTLARWRRDGRLEHVGPSVTVGVHPVRPDRVEAALAAHPAVSQAVVVAAGDRLVAHVVPSRAAVTAVDGAELRRFLIGQLPDHLVPAAVVTLGELPLTPDGTVDRAALPDAAGPGHRAGRTPQEVALCELVAEVLGVERVGIDDNLFALGVNSLMAGRLVSRMRRTLGIETSMRTIFQNPTIATLSGQVRAATTPSRPRLRRMTTTPGAT